MCYICSNEYAYTYVYVFICDVNKRSVVWPVVKVHILSHDPLTSLYVRVLVKLELLPLNKAKNAGMSISEYASLCADVLLY